jgi:hypothetical protein
MPYTAPASGLDILRRLTRGEVRQAREWRARRRGVLHLSHPCRLSGPPLANPAYIGLPHGGLMNRSEDGRVGSCERVKCLNLIRRRGDCVIAKAWLGAWKTSRTAYLGDPAYGRRRRGETARVPKPREIAAMHRTSSSSSPGGSCLRSCRVRTARCFPGDSAPGTLPGTGSA